MYQRQEREGLSNLAGNLRWLCPNCRIQLDDISNESIKCSHCEMEYPVVEGIPDLRMRKSNATWEEQDLEMARNFSSDVHKADLKAVVEQLSDRSEDSKLTQEMRVRQILAAHSKCLHQLNGWLSPITSEGGLILDVGCGTGGFLAAAASKKINAAGIDASMTNLVAAKHMIEAHGGFAKLACAYAENLPIEDHCLSAVTMNDSIEHVSCVKSAIAEAHRALKVDGHLAIATPNRFSLTREPHVLVWGVGWLPRRLQAAYVKWRIDQPYDHTRLMSTWEMSRTLKGQQGLKFEFIVPPVPMEEIDGFPPLRSTLARIYNRIHHWRLVRPLMLFIGPFYQIAAKRTS